MYPLPPVETQKDVNYYIKSRVHCEVLPSAPFRDPEALTVYNEFEHRLTLQFGPEKCKSHAAAAAAVPLV